MNTAVARILDNPEPPDVEPIVLTPQREKFARAVVEIGVPSRAYRIAYKVRETTRQETIWSEASRLMHDPKVGARIRQLIAEAGARAGVTVESLVVEFNQIRAGALEDRQWSPANAATRNKALVTGHLREEATRTGDVHIHFDIADRGLL